MKLTRKIKVLGIIVILCVSSLCTVGCGTETATEKKVNKTQSKDKKKIKVAFKCVADDLSVNNKNQMTMMYNQVNKKVTSVNVEDMYIILNDEKYKVGLSGNYSVDGYIGQGKKIIIKNCFVNIEGNKQKITMTILQDTPIANNGKAMMSWE